MKRIVVLAIILIGRCSPNSTAVDPKSENSDIAKGVLEVSVQSLGLKESPKGSSKAHISLPRHSLLLQLNRPPETEILRGNRIDWQKVRTLDGHTGFVPLMYVRKLSVFKNPVSEESITDIACNSKGCDSPREESLLNRFPQIFQREGRSLTISLLDGQSFVLTDAENLDLETAVVYRLSDYYQEVELILLESRLYEGGSYLLVDRSSGEKLTLWSKPTFSPSGELLLTCSASFAYDTSGIQIIDSTSIPPRIVFESSAVSYPTDCRWNTNKKVAFTEQKRTTLGWVRQGRFILSKASGWFLAD
tara:strand:+ start:73 stop:984 length:912 start_codon:yes stop_codon:yes gene_type:complete